ncbi:MAG: ABC transporter ATP-binding protein [Oscillospiraceae bacterium]|nr:ABC transporter ATP-binding protein [Oscillospiraceae bacterium]
MSEPILRVQALDAGYHGRVIQKGVSFEVAPGEILVLIGPNGAGKSTILRTVTGQLPPLGGRITLAGTPLGQYSPRQAARHMAVLMTERVRMEYAPCREIVGMGRYPYTGHLGLLSPEDRRAVSDAMALADVTDLADRDFSSLSDGQRQRVLLARAICQEPELLVLDEPTMHLDIRYQLSLLGVLRRLTRERNAAVLMTLHELELAQRIADRVLCIRPGCPDRCGTPEEVFESGYIAQLFGVEAHAFDALYSTLELPAAQGPPQVFVICGGGSGVPVFRQLQRRGIPFAAGVLHENDLDLPAARALAVQVVTEEGFVPISEERLRQAKDIMERCDAVICTVPSFGPMNEGCKSLLAHARSLGKLRDPETIAQKT